MSEPMARAGVPSAFLALCLGLALPAWGDEVDDPMRPPQNESSSSQVSRHPGWDLSSVLISDDRRLAVINGQVLRPGEHVAGARVVRIEPDHVLIRHADGERRLSLRTGLNISRSNHQ